MGEGELASPTVATWRDSFRLMANVQASDPLAPHLARWTAGGDYRRVLPVAKLAGATLTLAADTLPRALFGRDVPAGVTLALIGAPVLVWIARRRTA